jgi:hypothetical protein
MWPRADGGLVLGGRLPGEGQSMTARSAQPLPAPTPSQRPRPMPPPFRIPAPQPTPSRPHSSFLQRSVTQQPVRTSLRATTPCLLPLAAAQQVQPLSAQRRTLPSRSVPVRRVQMRSVRLSLLPQASQRRPQGLIATRLRLGTLPSSTRQPRALTRSLRTTRCPQRSATLHQGRTVFQRARLLSQLSALRRWGQIKSGPIRPLSRPSAMEYLGSTLSRLGHCGFR